MKQITRTLAAALLLLLLGTSAQAALQARDLNGDTVTDAYYDTELDITWLRDLLSFESHPLTGPAATNKGIAPFPRPIKGELYVLVRSDGETNGLAHSPDGLAWGRETAIRGPVLPWEIVKSGNCGSPIETDEGWLVITQRHLFVCLAAPGPDPDLPLLRTGVRTWTADSDQLQTTVAMGWYTDADGNVQIEAPGRVETRRLEIVRGGVRLWQDRRDHLDFERVE